MHLNQDIPTRFASINESVLRRAYELGHSCNPQPVKCGSKKWPLELYCRHNDPGLDFEQADFSRRIIFLNFTSLGDAAITIPALARDKFVELRCKNKTGTPSYGFVEQAYNADDWSTCEGVSDFEPCEQICRAINELFLLDVGHEIIVNS